jgi:hypothetical protein
LLHDNLLTVEVGCLRCEAAYPASKPCVENYDGVVTLGMEAGFRAIAGA